MNPSTEPMPAAGEPNPALFFVLHYLDLPELLSMEQCSRSLRSAVAGDSLLWREIKVEEPLNSKITDEALMRICERADGALERLCLLECRNISEGALFDVVDRNRGIKKLCVPFCTLLSADGILRAVEHLAKCNGFLTHLSVCGLVNTSAEHLEMFKQYMFLHNPKQGKRPRLYGKSRFFPLDDDDGHPIDVEICPKCQNVRMVFDCSRETCRLTKIGRFECRGCFFCIARCDRCGGCLDFEEHGEETVCCSQLLCLDCWLQLPKCNTCNRPYCMRHSPFLEDSSTPAGFICPQCNINEVLSYTDN